MNEVKTTKKKPWNKKVITTSNQWNHNASGSKSVEEYSLLQIYEAIDEYKNNCSYYN